jgi:anaerobic magnesium-protoporphyrin IX monomethyl ester cyclase
MRIGCVYTVETYAEIKQPFSGATEIPFGISIILTVLQEAGHEVELFVITPDTPLDQYIGSYVKEKQPSLFCFTAVSTQYWQAKKVAQYISNIDKSIFCVLGGHHASLNSEEVINDGVFDAICIGEGEKAVLELADSLSKKITNSNEIGSLWVKDRETGEIHKNPTAEFRGDLDTLPYINRKAWDKWIVRPDDYPAILLGRGCPFKCTYCSNHAMEKLSDGDYVRFRSPEHIVGEIEYIRREYPGVERIYLEVETFGANRKASYAVFDALAEYNQALETPITYGVNMALTSNYMMNSERRFELFEKVRAANIKTINIGLESGSERMRKLLKRPEYNNDELVQFCQLAKKYDIRVVFFVLLGLPGETIEDYNETVRVAREAQPYLCYTSIFFPYLGTDLATTAISMGLIDETNLSPRSERSRAVLDMEGFSSKRIRFEYVVFCWRVYKGHWPILRVMANVVAAFLKAYPKCYSVYLFVRNNTAFVMNLANRYGGASHQLRKAATTVGTRVDVMRE